MKIKYIIIVLMLVVSCTQKKQTIATIGNVSITMDEVDATIEPLLFQHLMNIYHDRSMALNKLIGLRLLSAEATKRKMTFSNFIDSLYQNEISKNASDVGNLQHDSTLRDDVIRFLKAKWIDSLKISYGVQISLQAPQKMIIVDMKEAPCHYRNDIESLLTVWIISDFDCPLCRELKPVFDSVYYKYQDKIRFADVYFSDEVSSSSIAAECASLQNKYWEVHDSLYAKTFQNKQDLTDLAYTMGMDTMQFNKDFDNYLLRDTITRNINALASKGLFGTPTIIIGRKLFMNVNSVDELSALIDKEWNRL